MRPYALLIVSTLCLISSKCVFGQIQVTQISGNKISAKINNTGVLFHDGRSGSPAFEVPKGSNAHAFLSTALTMGGVEKNNSNSLRAASAYGINGDYSTGPLILGMATSSDSIKMVYNKIWEVNRNQINQHRMNFSSPSYTTPADILSWPAHGDTTAGYDFYLAPFIDVNQNGVYEPNSGDYPDVLGDFAIYFINNDNTQHPFTNTLALGVEIHCMVYGYSRNNALNEALFVDYKVINRSNLTYTDFYIGQYVDPDLGNPTDDYLEADVNRGMIFVKNGDNFDDPHNGFSGYGSKLGAAGILILRGPFLDSNNLDDSCLVSPHYTPNGWGFEDEEVDNERLGLTNFMPINNNNYNDGLPSLSINYYDYLRGRWKNGKSLVFGGNGFSSGGTDCRIAYFGDTDPTFYGSFRDTVTNNWREDGNNNAGDRLAMFSSGPVTFSPQEEIHLTYAFIFARDTSNTGVPASVDTLKNSADFIREFYFYSNGLSNCYNTVSIKEQNTQNLTVYPIPTSNYITVKNIPSNSEFRLYAINGSLMHQGNLTTEDGVIDLSSFKNGIYLLQIQSSEGLLQTKVIVAR